MTPLDVERRLQYQPTLTISQIDLTRSCIEYRAVSHSCGCQVLGQKGEYGKSNKHTPQELFSARAYRIEVGQV